MKLVIMQNVTNDDINFNNLTVKPDEWFGILDNTTCTGEANEGFVGTGCIPVHTTGELSATGNLRIDYMEERWKTSYIDPRHIDLPADFTEFVRSNLAGIKERWF